MNRAMYHPEYKLRLSQGWRVKIWSNGRIEETLEFYNSYDEAEAAFQEWVRRRYDQRRAG